MLNQTRSIEELSFKNVPQWLGSYLLNLRDRLASADLNGKSSTVELDSIESQLAAALGTISATLSRVFYRVTSKGMISINGLQIEVLDRDRFRS